MTVKTLPSHLFGEHLQFTGPLPITPDLRIKAVDTNWVTGIYKDKWFQAKVFATPSTFGIKNGRVSKLCISTSDKWMGMDHMLFNYDRGMDINHKMGRDLAAIFDKCI